MPSRQHHPRYIMTRRTYRTSSPLNIKRKEIMSKEVIYGLYNDETDLLHAIQVANDKHLAIMDVLLHSLSMGWIRHCISLNRDYTEVVLCTDFGYSHCFLRYDLDVYKRLADYFWRKPYWSVPAFIPITFELTVLFCLGMTITFYIIWDGSVWLNPYWMKESQMINSVLHLIKKIRMQVLQMIF